MNTISKLALAALVSAAATAAGAHDTWFEPLPPTPAGHAVFALSTGNRFPVQEFAIGFDWLVGSGCSGPGTTAAALAHVEDRPTALVLRSAARVDRSAGASCWAQLAPFELNDAPADKIELYFREIQASAALREAWAAIKARGLPWRERYTKHARVEVGGSGPRAPVAMAMDVLLDSPRQPIRAGDALVFQVLRDGAPLPDFPVELVSHLSPLGVWRKTDAQGRVRIALPLAGRWVLRGTDLRLSTTRADEWDSRFVTLAFEVGPAAR